MQIFSLDKEKKRNETLFQNDVFLKKSVLKKSLVSFDMVWFEYDFGWSFIVILSKQLRGKKMIKF
jgi:hypothetical protein